MIINEKELDYYHGLFISFAYAPSAYEAGIFYNGMSHIRINGEINPSNRELVLMFEKELDLSNFYSEIKKGAIIKIDDDFFYDCMLVAAPVVEHIGSRKYRVTFTLSSICKGAMITENNGVFVVVGNVICPCIYEITSVKNLERVTIDGIRIKNLRANKTFIIDGIDKLVYYKENPNVSAFDDTDLSRFPFLDVGSHTVTSNADISISVKYYPTYM